MYIIHVKDGRRYIGIANNMYRRIGQHVYRSRGALRREGLTAHDIDHISYLTYRGSRAGLRRVERMWIGAHGGPGNPRLLNRQS